MCLIVPRGQLKPGYVPRGSGINSLLLGNDEIACKFQALVCRYYDLLPIMLLSFAPRARVLGGKITFLIIAHSPLKLNKAIPFCQTPPLISSLSP